MPTIPGGYAERVYAGVLGKLIGVYLGRPFEGWTYDRIMQELGPINYYVNERRDVALRSHHLVVTDDDVSGTFAFPRTLADCGFPERLTSQQIGNGWLNYIVEDRSVLWWGGIGNSTEHTAYLRLKSGIPAPRSGSVELNGKTVAEQIGGQIFIDGWAMVSPGNPEQAAYLAEQAARVSHDGEAVHAARLLAAMEAQAFVEADVQKLVDIGLGFVPADCLIRRVVDDVRAWHAGDNGNDWERTRALIAGRYGYDKFSGNCHVVPNHALVILATLYGADSFQDAMRIANTAGWDTDCNAGNVGCLFGIRTGLAGIDAGPDFRAPIADRMYISTADGGASITDAVIEANALIEAGHRLVGSNPPARPKNGARFNFDFPGSLQGFCAKSGEAASLHPLQVGNVEGHSQDGHRCLAVGFRRLARGRVARVATPTFFDKDVFTMPIYQLLACPTLHSGQLVEARVEAGSSVRDVSVRLYASVYDERDELAPIFGDRLPLQPGQDAVLTWRIPDTGGYPIFEIGLELETEDPLGADGTVFLDYLTWSGAPEARLYRPDDNLSTMWKHAWVNGASQFQTRWEGLRVTNGEGIGFVSQGSREWRDYRVSSVITPLLARRWGLAARLQGRERYYALMFDAVDGGRVTLLRRDHEETVLASNRFAWDVDRPYALELRLHDVEILAFIDGRQVFSVRDEGRLPLLGGAVGLVVDTGSISTKAVDISPL
ncbi:ADP-ribosylglycohydrolase family protein [uncultured Bradyrhizobium sp.]|uniref:ADP-ribosylglycohydrolase family protein n=1 Tax=Bradyrhizobium sp. TaxID=376 RepID=UPI0026258832|nr:ADP-ribosylglycohydrolase family protein [uncultured Bradyrhizobium sp.]